MNRGIAPDHLVKSFRPRSVDDAWHHFKDEWKLSEADLLDLVQHFGLYRETKLEQVKQDWNAQVGDLYFTYENVWGYWYGEAHLSVANKQEAAQAIIALQGYIKEQKGWYFGWVFQHEHLRKWLWELMHG